MCQRGPGDNRMATALPAITPAIRGPPRCRSAACQRGQIQAQFAACDRTCDIGELKVAVAGAQHGESVLDGQVEALIEHALGLLDDDPAVEGVLQLLGDHLLTAERALVQDADGGRVRQRLTELSGLGVPARRVPRKTGPSRR